MKYSKNGIPGGKKKELISQLDGMDRPEYGDLLKSVEIKEVTIITGIRRSGKSTLMYQMIDNLLKEGKTPEQILFINLEDKKLEKISLDDIYNEYRQSLNAVKKAYVFFDEIHKRPGWESWIRKKYDLKTNDKFVISGSCSHLLKKEYSTLLTGRNITFEVSPLSFKEYLNFKNIETAGKLNLLTTQSKNKIIGNLSQYLKLGGFPEVFFKPDLFKMKILEQYFDDIIYKDIIDRYNVNSQKIRDFAVLLIAEFTGEMSLRKIRGSLGLSYDSIKDYMAYFKEAFLFFILDHFSYSYKQQKILHSKIYCIDNGLRNSVSFKFSKDEGKLAENTVFMELKRRGKNIYYWKNKGEADFIVKNKDMSLTAINVTYTNNIDQREIDGLLEFKQNFDKTKELILITKDVDKRENGVNYVPLWKWLLS